MASRISRNEGAVRSVAATAAAGAQAKPTSAKLIARLAASARQQIAQQTQMAGGPADMLVQAAASVVIDGAVTAGAAAASGAIDGAVTAGAADAIAGTAADHMTTRLALSAKAIVARATRKLGAPAASMAQAVAGSVIDAAAAAAGRAANSRIDAATPVVKDTANARITAALVPAAKPVPVAAVVAAAVPAEPVAAIAATPMAVAVAAPAAPAVADAVAGGATALVAQATPAESKIPDFIGSSTPARPTEQGSKAQLSVTRCTISNGTVTVLRATEYKVMLNPGSFKHKRSISYNSKPVLGQIASDSKFASVEPDEVDFTLTFDGTGAVPLPPGQTRREVADQVKALCDVVYQYIGTSHEPSHVRLLWGTLILFGRMTSMATDYTLFKPSGDPLRATIALSFLGFMSSREAEAAAGRSSPDLSHSIRVRAGDTLPLLCHRIYGDPSYYAEVARANGLADFRRLQPGAMLHFPPLA